MGKSHRDNHHARLKRPTGFDIKAKRRDRVRRQERAKCDLCGQFHGRDNSCPTLEK